MVKRPVHANESVAHITLLYAIVIAIGVYLGKIKVFGQWLL